MHFFTVNLAMLAMTTIFNCLTGVMFGLLGSSRLLMQLCNSNSSQSSVNSCCSHWCLDKMFLAALKTWRSKLKEHTVTEMAYGMFPWHVS